MKKEKILGFDVCTYNEKKLLKNIFKDYLKNKQLFIVNINPEIIISNYKNEHIKRVFNEQKYQIPDGSGIVWASKHKKGKIKERITGIDLMLKMCERAQNSSAKIFLYGAKKDNIEKTKEELEKRYPKINIVGICNGYENEKKVVDDIEKTNADIVFVGVGSPKQEKFIIDNKERLKNVKIFMPVGGSFDVISKAKKRAPSWIINYNLEWLYRLLKEPKRIIRQTKLVKFIFYILKDKRKE